MVVVFSVTVPLFQVDSSFIVARFGRLIASLPDELWSVRLAIKREMGLLRRRPGFTRARVTRGRERVGPKAPIADDNM